LESFEEELNKSSKIIPEEEIKVPESVFVVPLYNKPAFPRVSIQIQVSNFAFSKFLQKCAKDGKCKKNKNI
jgi:hypothetical protein